MPSKNTTKVRLPKGHGLRQLLANDPGQLLLYAVEHVQEQAHYRKVPRVVRRARRRSQRVGWVHVSDLLQPCDRVLAARLLGHKLPEERISPRTRRIFDNGHFMHMRWQNYFLSLPPAFEVDINVPLARWPIVGEADIIVRHKEFGRLVVELKSMNGTRWKALKVAEPDNVRQANTYVALAGADGSLVWYESKDDQDCKIYHHESQPALFTPLLERVEGVLEMVLAARLPAPCGTCELDEYIGNLAWSDERVAALVVEREKWQSKSS